MTDQQTLLDDATESLTRVQSFDPEELVQTSKLGASSFKLAVEPARKIITLFKQLPATTLEYFSDTELTAVKNQANSVHQLFEQILAFDVNDGDVINRQNALVQKLSAAYQGNFTQLYPLISYSMAKSVDFNQLEEQGRASVQSIQDQTSKIMAEIESQREEAQVILEDVRKTAAEQGVSQQAVYFKEEADAHGSDAEKWRTYTVRMSVAVGIYGASTLFLHRIPFLVPQNTYETIQFTVGKVLIFFVLAYMLSLCAKNFLSNRHNEIVNRHRQNALMTYKALVDAGGSQEARDIILNHAASSVYRLHETGYAKSSESNGSSSSSIVEMMPRTSMPINANTAGS